MIAKRCIGIFLVLALVMGGCSCNLLADDRSTVYLDTHITRVYNQTVQTADSFSPPLAPEDIVKEATAVLYGDILSYEQADYGAYAVLKVREVLAGECDEQEVTLWHLDWIDEETDIEHGLVLREGYRVVVPIKSYDVDGAEQLFYGTTMSWQVYIAVDEDAFIPAGAVSPNYCGMDGQDASVKTLEQVREWVEECRRT